MSDIKLGNPIMDEPAHRDAIHIAVAPVVCDRDLCPGDHLALVPGSTDRVRRVSQGSKDAIGIADPFLKNNIPRHFKFWMLLYPQTITGLRHEWTHPAFKAADAPDASHERSVEWLENKASHLGVTYDQLIAACLRDDYRCSFGTDIDYNDEAQMQPELWEHLKIVTGVDVPADERPESFRCAC